MKDLALLLPLRAALSLLRRSRCVGRRERGSVEYVRGGAEVRWPQ